MGGDTAHAAFVFAGVCRRRVLAVRVRVVFAGHGRSQLAGLVAADVCGNAPIAGDECLERCGNQRVLVVAAFDLPTLVFAHPPCQRKAPSQFAANSHTVAAGTIHQRPFHRFVEP